MPFRLPLLMARHANPDANLVIRMFGQDLSDNLAGALPNAQVLCAYGVAAEAFAGAAFGEKIIHLFRLNKKTILVTEYQIEAGDTLNGLLLPEAAYGYGVVPILYQKEREVARLMPSEDIRLAVGDRMVVLATSNEFAPDRAGHQQHHAQRLAGTSGESVNQ